MNSIGDEGAKALAGALQTNTTLTSLNLNGLLLLLIFLLIFGWLDNPIGANSLKALDDTFNAKNSNIQCTLLRC